MEGERWLTGLVQWTRRSRFRLHLDVHRGVPLARVVGRYEFLPPNASGFTAFGSRMSAKRRRTPRYGLYREFQTVRGCKRNLGARKSQNHQLCSRNARHSPFPPRAAVPAGQEEFIPSATLERNRSAVLKGINCLKLIVAPTRC